ncbi:quinone oxidoreductase family protein [Actinacidiphila acididurans]|uniref:Zinc-binding dehydrogenase n=1 Tax=Actinacidiphila acididurans TaxID=2784346 RepID=A0ABS2U1A4_9ACTN|nr:zinc-binding dehydrogenase [Actinacidiphila acididurans]MBM9509127.1 zinc-binding dehydrogenase [Actinacidiphila acididurans]
MRAIVFEELGGPEVLKIAELPDPQPGPDEVAVAVAYAGVNFFDLMARSAGHRVAALPFVPGVEVAGVVRAVGERVTGFAPGDRVTAYTAAGGYAETAVVPAATAFALPEGISLRTGAALPNIVPTAYALLHDMARLQEGDRVLVHSAAGGVGTIAGQLARRAGASAVYGVVSDLGKAEHALAYGYDLVFTADTFADDVREATGGLGVDIALDPMGGEVLRRTLGTLGRFGRLLSYGNAAGGDLWQVGPGDLSTLGAAVASFSLPRLAAGDPARLRRIADRSFRLVADGEIQVPVTADFDLADAADAHRLLESRTSTGKLLLRVSER